MHKRFIYATLGICMLVLSGCQSQSPPPTSSTPSMPSPPSPPSSSSQPPSMPSPPSPPSSSSQPPSMPSPPSPPSSSSQPPSMPSPPSPPSSSSQPSSPSQSESSSQQQNQQNQSSDSESQQGQESSATNEQAQSSGQQSTSSEEEANRQSAAEDLLASGQDLIEAANSASTADQSSSAGQPASEAGEEWDPLIPESENQSLSEELIFTDETEQSSPSLSDSINQSNEQDQNSQTEQAAADDTTDSSVEEDSEPVAEAGAEWDPLVPDSESQSTAEELIFTDESEQSGQSAQAIQSASDSSHQNDELGQENQTQQAVAGDDLGSSPEDGSETIAAASSEAGTVAQDNQHGEDPAMQDLEQTLLQAGISINRAGEALADMSAGDDITNIEQILAEARIAVMVSEQALQTLIQDSPTGSDNSSKINEADAALAGANRALILATNALLSGDLGLPEASAEGSSASNQRISELDKALQDSIIVFQEGVLEARQVATQTQPPATATAGDLPPPIVINKSAIQESLSESSEEGDPLTSPVQQGRMLDETESAPVSPQVSSIPDDIPSPQGDDIVAQQLREAAIAEQDPDLQAKLWEEYKRYKEGM